MWFDPRLYCKVTVWKFVSFFVGRRYLLHLFCIKHLGFVTSVHPLFCLCFLLVVLNRIVESSLKGNKQQWDIKQNNTVIESLKSDRNINTMILFYLMKLIWKTLCVANNFCTPLCLARFHCQFLQMSFSIIFPYNHTWS